MSTVLIYAQWKIILTDGAKLLDKPFIIWYNIIRKEVDNMNKMCEHKGYTLYYDTNKKEYLVVTPNKRVTYNWKKLNKKVYNCFKQVVPKSYTTKTKKYLKRVGSYYGYVVYLDLNDTDFMLVVKSNKMPTTDLTEVPLWVLDCLLWYKDNYKGRPFYDVV